MKWISVDERLPDMGEEVIVWSNLHQKAYGAYYCQGRPQGKSLEFIRFIDGDMYTEWVTYWMLMPKGPTHETT
jgi:hypothetical protein